MDYKAILEHGFEQRVANLLAGLKATLPKGHSFQLARGSVSADAAIAQLEAFLALRDRAVAAERALTTARQARLAAVPKIHTLTEQLKVLLKAFHGAGDPQLLTYGLKPARPRAQPRSENKVAANARRANTRKIRGTKGPKERLQYKSGPVKVTVGAAKQE